MPYRCGNPAEPCQRPGAGDAPIPRKTGSGPVRRYSQAKTASIHPRLAVSDMDGQQMRSFIFCTSYLRPGTRRGATERWDKWLRYYSRRSHLFGAERLFLIDDGTAPGDITLPVSVVCADRELPTVLPEGAVMFRFSDHLGRSSPICYPGWWRSFTFASQIAWKYAYPKIIHIESDAYIISRRLAEYIRALSSGWTTLWCPRWRFPETCIQVICRAEIRTLGRHYRAGRALWCSDQDPCGCAEYVLPFTDVCRRFEGDRYGESGPGYPDTADYVCQARLETPFEHKLVPTDA
jgi:hypothetical protein